jgi:hypothetical protein
MHAARIDHQRPEPAIDDRAALPPAARKVTAHDRHAPRVQDRPFAAVTAAGIAMDDRINDRHRAAAVVDRAATSAKVVAPGKAVDTCPRNSHGPAVILEPSATAIVRPHRREIADHNLSTEDLKYPVDRPRIDHRRRASRTLNRHVRAQVEIARQRFVVLLAGDRQQVDTGRKSNNIPSTPASTTVDTGIEIRRPHRLPQRTITISVQLIPRRVDSDQRRIRNRDRSDKHNDHHEQQAGSKPAHRRPHLPGPLKVRQDPPAARKRVRLRVCSRPGPVSIRSS